MKTQPLPALTMLLSRHTRRREFITLVGGAVAWPETARAQQPERLARIGYLGQFAAQGENDVFRAGLSDRGYVEGKNLHIEFRFMEGDEDRLPGLAAELVGLNVDVIVTLATGVFAAYRATKTIPIVMVVGPDLVALGLVASLAHPGGNITGSTFFVPELMAKRLELLKEVVPSMARAGVLLVRREDNTNGNILEVMGATARALNVELQPIEVRGPWEYESAFSAWADQQISPLVMADHGQLLTNVDAIVALAARHRLPSIGPLQLPAGGGLMGYGVNFFDFFRRAGYFVDKILKGEKPGDIPIEQATTFKLVLNLKTAKAMGIELSTAIQLRADEVIE
jgi:putative tryptophan/tyrosine transport system substrate-binding protein